MAVDYQELQQNRGVAPENREQQKLSQQLAMRGVPIEVWNTLSKSLYPGAAHASVLMVIDYCKSRKLDPLKKPCHIVPMEVRDAKTGRHEWRDVVMPGIYELRITAHRTGEYMGHTEPEYGPEVDFEGVKAPEWCAMTMRRWNPKIERVVEFPVKVYFSEVVGLKDGKPNKKWRQSPRQMLTKCTEAAGLREAFPEEIGGQMAHEEVGGASTDFDLPTAPEEPNENVIEGELDDESPQEEPRPQQQPEPQKTEPQRSAPADLDDDGMSPLDFTRAFNLISRARTVEDLDVIRSRIKHLSERHRKSIEQSIENKLVKIRGQQEADDASRGPADDGGLRFE